MRDSESKKEQPDMIHAIGDFTKKSANALMTHGYYAGGLLGTGALKVFRAGKVTSNYWNNIYQLFPGNNKPMYGDDQFQNYVFSADKQNDYIRENFNTEQYGLNIETIKKDVKNIIESHKSDLIEAGIPETIDFDKLQTIDDIHKLYIQFKEHIKKNDKDKPENEELKKFNDSIENKIREWHREAQQRLDILALLASQNHDTNIPNYILGKDVEDDAKIAIAYDVPTELDDKDINIDNLFQNGSFKTMTGLEIKSDGANGLTLKFPDRFWDAPGYYTSLKKNVKSDLLTMAQLIKAQGSEQITMEIKMNGDPEKVRLLAVEAFEACREVGFEEKDIVIKVNNKVVKLYDTVKDEKVTQKGLFSSEGCEQKIMLDDKAKKLKDGREIYVPENLKKQLTELRQWEAEITPKEEPKEENKATPKV